MVFVLTGAGLAALIAGVLAVVAGLPILEFSYGNTLIMAGTFGAGCGLVVVALAQILRELRRQVLAAPAADAAHAEFARGMPPVADPTHSSPQVPSPQRGASVIAAHDATAWRDAPPSSQEMRRARINGDHNAEHSASLRPAKPSPRNLMFRKPVHSQAPSEANEAGLPASMRDAADETPLAPARVEGLWKRRRRETGSEHETSPKLDLARNEVPEAAAVTVLKSGMVDGLTYTLYSDGSIEAQLEEGLVRFDSIEALRAHLDRPV